MLEMLHSYIIPAAYHLLPAPMRSEAATAMLLAIALQESDRLKTRRQYAGGPARGFWQFELGGVRGVRRHRASRSHAEGVLADLVYFPGSTTDNEVLAVLEHNDVLAAVFARLLLWTLPDRLPTSDEVWVGWQQYLDAWRPGKPHRETWAENWAEAWRTVQGVQGVRTT